MTKADKPRSKGRDKPTKPRAPKRVNKAAKRPTNLTLEIDAIERGERFGKQHGVSLSQLVSRLLRGLPDDAEGLSRANLTPAVSRLYGVAERSSANIEAYRKHLRHKYGGETE